MLLCSVAVDAKLTSVGALPSTLQELRVGTNPMLAQLPPLGAALRALDVGRTQLTTLPGVDGSTRLTTLLAEDTQTLASTLTDAFLAGLPALQQLSLGGIVFDNGTAPTAYEGRALTLLDVRGNGRTTLPNLNASASTLRSLTVSNNPLSAGVLPPIVAQCTELTSLVAANNQLRGPLLDLSRLSQLTRLDVRDNELTLLSGDYSSMTKLRRLEAQHNNLTKFIDVPLHSLLTLLLSNNDIGESVALADSLFPSLTLLALEHNLLPAFYVDSHASLVDLYLHDNRLSMLTVRNTGKLKRVTFFDNLLKDSGTDASGAVGTASW